MRNPDLIWRFGRWVAHRESGSARLSCRTGDLVVRVRRGHIVSAVGPDPAAVGRLLGSPVGSEEELFEGARAIAGRLGIPETHAAAAVKQAIQDFLSEWLRDPGRGLELGDGAPADAGGSTISLTHLLVELILGDDSGKLAAAVLPDGALLLRRVPDFLELYSPLRLSEEADLVVAKITGQRTASEIAGRSPHGSDEVLRLLAALVATGMLEPAPLPEPAEEMPAPAIDPPVERVRRRLPVSWLIAAAAVVLAVLTLLAVLMVHRSKSTPEHASSAWGLVVDMGCQPEELQRVLRKAREHPATLRPVQAAADNGSPCWRLVWGQFPSREAALAEIGKVPSSLILQGFAPHPVELPEDRSTPEPE